MARKVKMCPCCQKAVSVKGFSFITFILLGCLGGFPAILYILYKMFVGSKCPLCGNRI